VLSPGTRWTSVALLSASITINLLDRQILSVHYRPPGTSAIAFVLKGPRNIELPGGSVSYSVA
jgi:hypothetical protein